MLKLRLKRVGKKHLPSYKLIIIKDKKKRSGKHIEILGYYNPFLKTYKFNITNTYKWLDKGIIPNKKTFYLLKKLNYIKNINP
uniref:Ribosomal protein S16 n=1 Tax=Nitzschia sp. NIES-3576 TaxID=2083273 RepID=A0A2Z5ZB20_9STRA|nr:ribosomal protein S16 [Nitzschia sp. NIES-3576]